MKLIGRKCAYKEKKGKKGTNIYVVLSMPDIVVAQWEQDEQGKSLFWKENSREGVYTSNYTKLESSEYNKVAFLPF